MPLGRLLVGVAHLKQQIFPQYVADQLNPDRQAAVVKAAGQAHAGQPGQVYGNRH